MPADTDAEQEQDLSDSNVVSVIPHFKIRVLTFKFSLAEVQFHMWASNFCLVFRNLPCAKTLFWTIFGVSGEWSTLEFPILS